MVVASNNPAPAPAPAPATATSTHSVSHSLLATYLLSRPRQQLDSLYSKHPATSLSLLRLLLSPRQQHRILARFLYSTLPLPLGDIILEEQQQQQQQQSSSSSSSLLLKLFILIPSAADPSSFVLHPALKASLHDCLIGGGSHNSFGQPCATPDTKNQVDIPLLDAYALEKWEAVLKFLVIRSAKVPTAVMTLLVDAGLMHKRSEDLDGEGIPDLVITQKGFQFLLQDTKYQVWQFLLQYLETSDRLNMSPTDILHFYFQLGSLELGQDYDVNALNDTQRQMLRDLKYLGLIYQRSKKSTRFYPTRLATTLTSAASTSLTTTSASSLLQSTGDGYIVLETNYRLYAYNVTPLQIAILSLFVDLRSRFPNMVMGMLTRDKARSAFEMGINSAQIVDYLMFHAHPEMRKTLPILPETVVDQLKLWELERNRLQMDQGHLYQQFAMMDDYLHLLAFTRRMECLLWCNERKRMLVVTGKGHELVKQYYKKAPAASGPSSDGGRIGGVSGNDPIVID